MLSLQLQGLHHRPLSSFFSRDPQECASDYQEMVADKCIHCNKGVRKGGGFSGSFYPVDRKPGDAEGEEGEAKVHLECFEAYQAKLVEEREEEAVAPPPETETALAAAEAAASGDSAAAENSTADATAAVAKPVADAEIETRADAAEVEAGAEAGAAKESKESS